jgi:transglutaminase-like putative cysteine protease
MRVQSLQLRSRAALVATMTFLISLASLRAATRFRHERLPPSLRPSVANREETKAAAASSPRPSGGARDSHDDGSLDDYRFDPDRNTSRPEGLQYEDAFRPSVAPFKRGMAFDAVDKNYRAHVASHATSLVPRQELSPELDVFRFTQKVALYNGRLTTLPSPGPSARILSARLTDVDSGTAYGFRILQDSAENWFLEPQGRSPKTAKLELEIGVPREVFGAAFGDPSWEDLPASSGLAEASMQDAVHRVTRELHLRERPRPREVVAKLVRYFRSFDASNDPPTGQGDIYLDLALSQKGVCRHRAFAFLVTALGLKIPARMVVNEAHAWVEVHNGKLWKRIDLGGAGVAAESMVAEQHRPPEDPFAWPEGANRGADFAANAHARDPLADWLQHADAHGRGENPGSAGAGSGAGSSAASAGTSTSAPNSSTNSASSSASGATNAAASTSGGAVASGIPNGSAGPKASAASLSTSPMPQLSGSAAGLAAASTRANEDDQGNAHGLRRSESQVTLSLLGSPSSTKVGETLTVEGTVRSLGAGCPDTAVAILLEEVKSGGFVMVLGNTATDTSGKFRAELQVPRGVAAGRYEVSATTRGSLRCGPGRTQL